MRSHDSRRRAVLALGALGAALAAPSIRAQATWPTRPVKLMVPFPPGGGADFVARLVGKQLGELWGQPVVIDNKPGASTMIASEAVARSEPDGHTLLLAVSNHSSNPAMFSRIPYDTLKDFAPITMLGSAPMVVVTHPNVPAKTMRELVALMQSRPGKLSYGSAGNGSVGHLAGEMFKQMAKVDILHVPYKGTGPAEIDLMAGTIDMMFTGVVSAAPQIRAGKMRGISVGSRTRSSVLPELPPVHDDLPGFESAIWYGLLGPAGMPRNVVAKIHADAVRVINDPEVRQKLLGQGAEPIGSSPEEFRRHIEMEVEKFRQVVKAAGIKVE